MVSSRKNAPLVDTETGYGLAAPYYDEKINFLNSFEQGAILPLLGDLKDKAVLDVGAGTGRLSIQMEKQGARVVAVDGSAQMLSVLAKKNNNIQTVLSDAENLPFPNDNFDAVVAAFLIVHLKDPTVFFTEVHRVLKEGGLFLVTNINQRKPPAVKTGQGPIIIESHYHRPEKIRGTLEALAFSVEKELFIKENATWINQVLLARK